HQRLTLPPPPPPAHAGGLTVVLSLQFGGPLTFTVLPYTTLFRSADSQVVTQDVTLIVDPPGDPEFTASAAHTQEDVASALTINLSNANAPFRDALASVDVTILVLPAGAVVQQNGTPLSLTNGDDP